ncbi:MAG TPA: universal stress protein [Ohtaekwangia sp.]|uniref:universal stress protein n=1 Tax=Ohtaekwangia sp. TaxID=2066019 RepID=UPI002F91FA15
MKKILVPCDFSGTAMQAFDLAVEIAKKSKGEVLVMHAIEFAPAYETSFVAQPYVFNATMQEELEKDAQKNFEEMMRTRDIDIDSLPVSFYTDHGTITDTITQFIDDHGIDLVVMGTHGASGLKEFFVGSNAEKVVRFSHVPVLAVKSPVSLTSLHSIVLPTMPDLSHHLFVEKVKMLQNFLQAQLHILYVNTPVNYRPEKDIQAELKDFARFYKLEHYTVNIVNSTDEPTGIIAFAHDEHADMIAMSTHGRKGLAHFFNGSIAEDVVNHVDCPIWTCTLNEA